MPFDKVRSFMSYLSNKLECKYNIGQKEMWINPNKKTIFSVVRIIANSCLLSIATVLKR